MYSFLRLRRDRAVAAAMVAVAILAASLVVATPAHAVGSTFYVNNQAGANCSNSAAGTSTTQPWCDFTPANSRVFQPGDSLLLARGATWVQPLYLSGTGTSANWITVGAYGSGARPIIRGNSQPSDRTLNLSNPDYWQISDLEISHAGQGIWVHYTTKGHSGLRFTDLYFHDLDAVVQGQPTGGIDGYWSTSITVGASGFTLAAGESVAQNITLDRIRSDNATAPSFQGPTFGFDTGSIDKGAYQNLTIKNSRFLNANGGLSLQSVSNARLVGNVIRGMGQDHKATGQTSLFLWSSSNVSLQNNWITETAHTNSPDQTGVDLEGYVDHVAIRGNLVSNNAGAGIEALQINSRPGDFNTDHVVANNTFIANNTSGSAYAGAMFFGGTASTQSGQFSGNTWHEAVGPLTNRPPAWTETDNANINASTKIYPATFTTGGTWSAESISGSTYSSLTWDGPNDRWGSGSSYVDAFNALPGSGTGVGVARTWTAPATGAININGHLVKNDEGGDGIDARITRNGVQIWPASGSASLSGSDSAGMPTALSNATVYAGDKVRFEVRNGSSGQATLDLTSWMPTIAYVSDDTRPDVARGSYSSSSQWDASQAPSKAFDDNSATNWQAAQGSSFASQWLQVDFGGYKTVDTVAINEWGGRTTGFKIQSWNGSTWSDAYTGTTIGPDFRAAFPRVTTDKIRLQFTSGSFTPIIKTFSLYAADLSNGGTYSASSHWNLGQTAAMAFDKAPATNWQAASGSVFGNQWLQVDLPATITVNAARFTEWGNRTASYSIQSWSGSAWVDAYAAGSISTGIVTFPAVTTSKLRLRFLSGSHTPVINEVQYFYQ